MLHQFLKVCNARLGLSSSHIFLYRDEQNVLCKSDGFKSCTLAHFTSLPDRHSGKLWSENTELLESARLIGSNDQKKIEHFDYFAIEDIGVLVIAHEDTITEMVRNILLPVISKLAMSCQASINHYTLIKEVDARKVAEEQMLYRAYHDEVTGLSNRLSFRDTLQREISICREQKKAGAVLFVDLNDFKSINDLMGHQIGDVILHQVAERLNNTLPTANMIARFGGDEFTVLLIDDDGSIDRLQKRIDAHIVDIVSAIESGFSVKDNHFAMTCCIGYDVFGPNYIKTATELLKNADLAMYEAKRTSSNTGMLYMPAMSEALDNRIAYISDIKSALKNNEFELHYQPQYDKDCCIIGAEALLRWYSPTRGYVPPDQYIGIAEESDLIVAIGDWVMERASRDIATLESMGLPSSFHSVSINVSARQLAKDDFEHKIRSVITSHNINPQRLSIEITEGIMVGNIERSILLLEKLRRLGVNSSIDDFGTGYSSLTYLKRLPANLIKIDRSFITDIHKDLSNQSIVTMIIGLATSLKMEVIAEGVENMDELDYLSEIHCGQYQGYYFCKPVPLEQLIEKIAASGSHQ